MDRARGAHGPLLIRDHLSALWIIRAIMQPTPAVAAAEARVSLETGRLADSSPMAENANRARARTAIAASAAVTLAMALGYAQLAAHRRRHSLSGAVLRIALRATWREARATAKDGRARVRAVASRG